MHPGPALSDCNANVLLIMQLHPELATARSDPADCVSHVLMLVNIASECCVLSRPDLGGRSRSGESIAQQPRSMASSHRAYTTWIKNELLAAWADLTKPPAAIAMKNCENMEHFLLHDSNNGRPLSHHQAQASSDDARLEEHAGEKEQQRIRALHCAHACHIL